MAIAQAKQPQDKKPALPPRTEMRRAVSVETRPQLFATLCALDAAGFDSSVNTTNQSPGRVKLRERMLALQGPAVDALRTYYQEHALADSGATFARFVSFALAAGPPPKFAFELRREDLPPDALALEGFNEVLANFYREAQLDQLWQLYQRDYESGVEYYSAPLSQVAFTATSYLREIIKSNSPRTFSLYVEPLAGEKPISEITETITNSLSALLLIHPWKTFGTPSSISSSILWRFDTGPKRPGPRLCWNTPLMPPGCQLSFTTTIPLFLTSAWSAPSSCGFATSPRLIWPRRSTRQKNSGYVLVRPIYAGLSGFEKSEPAMSYYLPELIKGIDVAGESRRLRGVKFADVAPAGEPSRRRGAPPFRPRGPLFLAIPWKNTWPKGSAKFPPAMARQPRPRLNESLPLIPMTCAQPMGWR